MEILVHIEVSMKHWGRRYMYRTPCTYRSLHGNAGVVGALIDLNTCRSPLAYTIYAIPHRNVGGVRLPSRAPFSIYRHPQINIKGHIGF